MMGKKVKIVCGGCDGKGWLHEIEYKTGKVVRVVCPVCKGKGFTYYEKWEE